MMRREKAIEGFKNAGILCLILLLLVQFLIYWIIGIDVSNLAVDSPVRRIYAFFNQGAFGYDIRISGVSAVEPIQIAVASPDEVMAVQYADVRISLEQLTNVFESAIPSATNFHPIDNNTYLQQLEKGNAIVLHYFEERPLSAIASGLKTSSKSELGAVSITIFAEDSLLVLRDKSGALSSAKILLDRTAFEATVKEFRGLRCQFASNDFSVIPESLLFEQESLRFSVLKNTRINPLDTNSDASLKMLLEAFSYTTDARFYTEQNQSVYGYADKYSTLRITDEGEVAFHSSNQQSPVVAFEKGEITESSAILTAQIASAYDILRKVLDSIGSEAQAMLATISQGQDGLTRIAFMQCYDGVPVVNEAPFASFIFSDNVLVTASVTLELLTPDYSREETLVFPAAMAATTATGENRRIVVAYTKEQDVYVAQRYFID